MWIVRECDRCNNEPASIMCDHCGCKACVCCSLLLRSTIEDHLGGRYKELCNDCARSVSADGTSYNSVPKPLVLQGSKDIKEETDVSRR